MFGKMNTMMNPKIHFLQQFDEAGNFIEKSEEEIHTADPSLEIRYNFKEKDV